MDWEKGEGHPFQYCVYGAACSEVEVDCLTGDYKVRNEDIFFYSKWVISLQASALLCSRNLYLGSIAQLTLSSEIV